MPVWMLMAASGADDVAALNEALDVEKMANSQLQEQVDALGEKLAGQEDQLRDLEQHTKRLNDENAELRLSSEKIAADAADADAANVAIRTELEALRVTRKTDLAELQTIMDELKPIIAGGV